MGPGATFSGSEGAMSDENDDDSDHDSEGDEGGFPGIDLAGLLSSDDEDGDEGEVIPPTTVTPFSKKRKDLDDERVGGSKAKKSKSKPTLEDEEELALRLLEG